MEIKNIDQHIENHRAANLPRLWQMHNNVIRAAIYTMSFVHSHNYDDYYQEAFIFIWQKYKYFYAVRDSFEFGAWLYVNVRRGVMGYRCRLNGYKSYRKEALNEDKRTLLVPDFSAIEAKGHFAKAYEVFENGKMQSLMKAIEDLPAADRKIVRLFLDDVDLNEMAKGEGKAINFYTAKLRRAVDRIRHSYRKYFEDVRIFPGQKKPDKQRPILQYDLDGNLIGRFESCYATWKELGINSSNVIKAARGEIFSYMGFRWAYEDEGKLPDKELIRKPILQLSLSGQLIKEWDSQKQAIAALNLDSPPLNRCLKGKRKSYRGFIWAYPGESNARVVEFSSKKTTARRILQLDEHGKPVCEWKSITDAIKAGHAKSGIRECLSGRKDLHKGYKWQYAS